MKIIIGSEVKDRITGFSGVVTGRAEYITGCTQCLVVPRLSADGNYREGQWFDEQRLDPISAVVHKLDNSQTPGPDRAAPKR